MIRVQAEDFDAGAECRALAEAAGDAGAVVTFTGIVRRGAGAQAIRSLTLEHYPGMTEKELERIEAEARTRWPLTACVVIHRHGRLLPGENIVFVGAASSHRQAAFEAAQFLMDYLKTSAPFWKMEEREEGGTGWVEAKASDDAAAAKWGGQ